MTQWPIDPRNPGEVFACAGLAHLAWRADPTAQTGFVKGADGRLRFVAPDDALPSEDPALEPLAGRPHERLRFAGVELDWWCPWGLNPNLKNWAGQQSAWTVHRSLHSAAAGSKPAEWLTYAAPATGRLYVDPAGTWNALSLGWSVNAHPELRMGCRPWVELLASIGLQALPVPGHRARGGFHYCLWRPAPLPSAIAAFGGPWSQPCALQRYHVSTRKARTITMLRQAAPATIGGSPAEPD